MDCGLARFSDLFYYCGLARLIGLMRLIRLIDRMFPTAHTKTPPVQSNQSNSNQSNSNQYNSNQFTTRA
uniref:Uncharacterized protein n=1 Tax=Picea sitchensis TaxID=3332 RepID=A0A6B9XZJ4_PICSI|nr:hypothetical protein Q903MT_gene6944 [Picea sitchensis]